MKILKPLGVFFWLIVFGAHFACLGAPVSREQALRVAARWHALTPHPMRKPAGRIGKINTYANAAGEARFHVVDLEPAGFIVIAADDQMEPVVAFSHEGKFIAGNPLFDILLRDTEGRIRVSRANAAARQPASRAELKAKGKWDMLGAPAAPAAAAPSSTTSVDDECVAPLVQTQWSQSTTDTGNISVYNYYTPPFSTPGVPTNYVCGCVATAVAQIFRYWEWPQSAVGTPSFSISVDGTPQQQALRGGDGAGGPYDWADMVLVAGTGVTLKQCQAIGALTADAGVASGMEYTQDESGANPSSATMRNTFHYANAACTSGSDYHLAIRTNLDAGQPVSLSIYGSAGGHEVVCDGYGYSMGTLYNHINIGWGPYWDGLDSIWYNLPTVAPPQSGYTFTSVTACYYNINPTITGEIISGRVTNLDGSPLPGVVVTAAGSTIRTGTTNQEGIYAFNGIPTSTRWTITPGKSGYVFNPSQTVVNIGYSAPDGGAVCNQTADFTVENVTLPVAITGAVNSVTTTSAILTGSVNASGYPTTAQFQYGLTATYGSAANVTLSPNNSSTAQNVSAAIGGLQPDTTYHYAITAANANGPATGADATFTTEGAPIVTTGTVDGITTTSATIYAAVDPSGFATTAQFQYGLTFSYGATANVTLSPNDGATPQSVSASIGGLLAGATYHYQIAATNSQGETTGSDATFTTMVMVSTFAGTAGLPGFADGAGSGARFYGPTGAAQDTMGNVYVADEWNDTIRKIAPDGTVSTLAGNPEVSGTANGQGSAARFTWPAGVAADGIGNVYVADEDNDTIRKITPTGLVSTVAGIPRAQGSADGIGSAAQFRNPTGVAVDGSGNIYVADQGNDTIREITAAGSVITLAGSAGVSGTADGIGSAAQFRSPYGIAVDRNGNLLVADQGNCTIRQITPGGQVSTLAGNPGVSGTADGAGSGASFYDPSGIAVDGIGNIYVADSGADTIRKVTSSGMVTTLAGTPWTRGSTDGNGDAALFYYPTGITADANGNVSVTDYYNYTIRKITQWLNPSPIVTLLGSNPLTFEAGNSYTDAGAAATDPTDGAIAPGMTANTVVPNQPGAYSVTWTATDSVGLTGTATRTVHVVDTTPPVITVPQNMTVYTTANTGTTVNFATSAWDLVSGPVSTTDSPASGSQFPIGTTTVTTTASDAAGNQASRTFIVTVAVPQPILAIDYPAGTLLSGGTGSSVSAGSVGILTGTQMTFTVQNVGTAPLTNLIAAVSGNAAFTVGAPGSNILTPGQSTTVTVTFLPQTTGTQSGSLSITAGGVSSPFSTTLTGTGVGASIAVSYPPGATLPSGNTNYASIGSAGVLTGSQSTFTVQNLGPGTLSNLAVAVSGNPAFTGVSPVATTLTSGQSTTFGVNFSPKTVGAQSALLTVTGSGLASSFQTMITGTGAGGAIAVNYPAGVPLTSGSTNYVSMGTVGVLSGTQAMFTVQNIGLGTISNLSGTVLGNPSFTVGSPVSTTLVSGQSTTVLVRFSPRAIGAQSGILSLTGSSVLSPFQAGLTGTGVGATITVDYPAGTPLASGSSTVNFGAALLGAKAPLTIEVLNNSPTNLVLSSWSLIGVNAIEFSATVRVPVTIPPGSSVSYVVTFSPQAIGTRAATLEFLSNDPVTPLFSISLAGTGLSYTQMAGKFAGNINGGMLSVTLTKTGAFTGQLLLNGVTIPIKGVFGANGTFSGGFGKPPVLVTLALGSVGITGFAGGESVTLYPSASSVEKVIPEAGKYTFLLTQAEPSAAAPAGSGYGSLTVSATGNVTMAGKLADGTAFSTKGFVVEAGSCDGFAICVPGIYKGNGYLSGSVGFTGSAPYECAGTLDWHKPKQSGTAGYYIGGFDAALNLSGAPYPALASGSAALPFANGTVEISGGGIPSPISTLVTSSATSTLAVVGDNTANLKLSITAATGGLTGSFVHPVTSKTITFGGILFKDPANPCAAGFFLGPIVSGSGSAGAVTLTPYP